MKRIVLLLFVICTACGRNYNGMDISHHNAVNWDAVKSDGNLEFCYIKSTEGSTLTDRRCRAHLRKAKDAGLKVGSIIISVRTVPAKHSLRTSTNAFRRTNGT